MPFFSVFVDFAFSFDTGVAGGKCKIDKNGKNGINTNKKTKFDTKNVSKIVCSPLFFLILPFCFPDTNIKRASKKQGNDKQNKHSHKESLLDF